jgi:hypothetical protein
MHGNAYLTGHFLRTIIGINNSDNKKKSGYRTRVGIS